MSKIEKKRGKRGEKEGKREETEKFVEIWRIYQEKEYLLLRLKAKIYKKDGYIIIVSFQNFTLGLLANVSTFGQFLKDINQYGNLLHGCPVGLDKPKFTERDLLDRARKA